MEDQNSDDWLPEGWTVEVRERRNGKKDKCYNGPGVRFFSKDEVCRYLKINKNEPEESDKGSSKKSGKKVVFEKATADDLPPGWTKEIKVTKKGRRVRRDPYYTDPVSGYVFRSMKDIRRYLDTGDIGRLAFKRKERETDDVNLENDDDYSTSPTKRQKLGVNGMRAESMSPSSEMHEISDDEQTINDVSSSGECKSLFESPTGKGRASTELRKSSLPEAGDLESAEVAKKLEEAALAKVSVGGKAAELRGSFLTESVISLDVWGNKELGAKISVSNLPEARDSRHPECTTKSEETASFTDSQGTVCAKLSCSNLPESGGTHQIERDLKVEETATITYSGGSGHVEEEDDLNKKGSVSASAVEESPDNKPPSESGTTTTDKKMRNSKKKNEFSTPRRVSRRLAGVPLDPAPELETIFRTRRSAGKQSGEADVKCSIIDDPKSAEELPEPYNINNPARNLLNSCQEKVQTGNQSGNKQGNTSVLLMDDIVTPEICVENVRADVQVNEQSENPLELPLADLWTDPCIAFAIKTLTGEALDSSENAELSSLTKNTGNPFLGVPIVEDHSRKEQPRIVGDTSQGSSASLPVRGLVTPNGHAKGVETIDKVDNNPGFDVDTSFMEMWRDPCIEFAIKTLTGEIPVGLEVDNQEYCQQQQVSSSSHTQASSSSTVPEVGLDNFFQTGFLCQQFNTAEKRIPTEQQTPLPSLGPGFHPSSVTFQNSSAANLQQRSQWRCRG